jgi:ribokinase
MRLDQKFDIVVVGSNMIDLLSKIPRLPKMGETLIGSAFHFGFGGKGANQAVMAARLGAKVAMVTRVGDDLFGSMTQENFRQQGVDTTFVLVETGISSGVAPAMVDENGKNMLVIIPGANMRLTLEDIRQASQFIQFAKILICQLEIPDEAVEEAFRIARAAGVMTILNPAPARAISAELIALADLIVPNETEAEILTEIPVSGMSGTAEAAEKLIAIGAKAVILTLGENGAMLFENNESFHFPAFSVKAVDTTGAGDAFIGGLAFGLSTGRSIRDAIPFANQCGAFSVTRIGTQVSFPTYEDLANFRPVTE